MSKTITESKTMITGITASVGSLTALIMHFTGIAVLGPEALGAAISALISGVIFTILRLKTSKPISSKPSPPGSTIMIVLMVLVFCGLSGCVRTFQAKKSVKIKIVKSPCKVEVHSDGELVFKLTSKVKCGVTQ